MWATQNLDYEDSEFDQDDLVIKNENDMDDLLKVLIHELDTVDNKPGSAKYV